MKPVSLSDPYRGPECCPVPVQGSPVYPTVYLSVKEGELDFPDSGVVTFRFRLSRESEDKKQGKCSYDLDLMEVLNIKADSKEKPEYEVESAGDALDKAMKGKK